MKNLWKYPTTYLIALLLIYSVYDYFEHILRPGSTFEEHPWYWLLFTSSAVSSFIIVVLMMKKLIQKMTNKKNLLFEMVAIGIWLASYLFLIGPLIDEFFWPFDDLFFRFKMGPFFIILIAFFVMRVIINLVMKKKVFYSK